MNKQVLSDRLQHAVSMVRSKRIQLASAINAESAAEVGLELNLNDAILHNKEYAELKNERQRKAWLREGYSVPYGELELLSRDVRRCNVELQTALDELTAVKYLVRIWFGGTDNA